MREEVEGIEELENKAPCVAGPASPPLTQLSEYL